MYKVVLMKGTSGEVVWKEETLASAIRRAHSLSELHGKCPVSEYPDTILIDARAWYEKKGVSK